MELVGFVLLLSRLYLHACVPGAFVGVVVVVIVTVMGVFYVISLFLYTINGFVVFLLFLCGVLLVLVYGGVVLLILLFGVEMGMGMLGIFL